MLVISNPILGRIIFDLTILWFDLLNKLLFDLSMIEYFESSLSQFRLN